MSGEIPLSSRAKDALPWAGAIVTGYLVRDGQLGLAAVGAALSAGSLLSVLDRTRRRGAHDAHAKANEESVKLYNKAILATGLEAFQNLFPNPDDTPLYKSLDGLETFTDPATLALSIARTPNEATAKVNRIMEQAKQRKLEIGEVEVLRKVLGLLSFAPVLAEYTTEKGLKPFREIEDIVGLYEHRYSLEPTGKI
jgi:hypothetical protein